MKLRTGFNALVRQPHLKSGLPPRVLSFDCGRRCRWLQFDGHLLDLAVEFERHRIACTHRRAFVGANVGAFVGGEHATLGLFDPTRSYLLPVDKNRTRAAFAGATSVIDELETDRGFPSG